MAGAIVHHGGTETRRCAEPAAPGEDLHSKTKRIGKRVGTLARRSGALRSPCLRGEITSGCRYGFAGPYRGFRGKSSSTWRRSPGRGSRVGLVAVDPAVVVVLVVQRDLRIAPRSRRSRGHADAVSGDEVELVDRIELVKPSGVSPASVAQLAQRRLPGGLPRSIRPWMAPHAPSRTRLWRGAVEESRAARRQWPAGRRSR